jgi:DNA-binding LytR/AlgR family response regulator
MGNPTALLVEDEAVLRAELRAQLQRLWPELRIVAEAAHGIEALRLLDEYDPDVLFLDIQVPGISGLEIARRVQGRCHVVFVTAYDAHAVAAFEQGAIDYVLKPIEPERLALAVHRVTRRLDAAPANLEQLLQTLAAGVGPRPYLRWINASLGDTVHLITVDDVCYFQADTGYTRVVTVQGEALIRRSLKELQEQLDPSMFWTVHRSTIVNVNAIGAVNRDFRGRVSIRLKSRPEKLPVSEAHAHLFRQM